MMAAREFKSLQFFLNRSAALAQYRQFLRVTAALPSAETRRDVRRQVRQAFEMHRGEGDDKRVAVLLRQGRDQLKMVGDLVDSAVAQQRLADEAAEAKDWKKGAWTESKDTWMDDAASAAGDGSEDDVKGRMGVGWPWQTKKTVRKIDLEGIKRR